MGWEETRHHSDWLETIKQSKRFIQIWKRFEGDWKMFSLKFREWSSLPNWKCIFWKTNGMLRYHGVGMWRAYQSTFENEYSKKYPNSKLESSRYPMIDVYLCVCVLSFVNRIKMILEPFLSFYSNSECAFFDHRNGIFLRQTAGYAWIRPF